MPTANFEDIEPEKSASFDDIADFEPNKQVISTAEESAPYIPEARYEQLPFGQYLKKVLEPVGEPVFKAREVGYLERFHDILFGGQAGETGLGRAFPGASTARTTAAKTGDLPEIRTENALRPESDIARSVAEGTPENEARNVEAVQQAVYGWSDQLTTPTNVAIALGTAGLGPAVAAGGSLIAGKAGAAIASKLVTLGFSAPMIKSAYDSIPEIKQAMDGGDTPTAIKLLTKAGLSVGLGVAGLTHGIGKLGDIVDSSIETHNLEAEQRLESERAAGESTQQQLETNVGGRITGTATSGRKLGRNPVASLGESAESSASEPAEQGGITVDINGKPHKIIGVGSASGTGRPGYMVLDETGKSVAGGSSADIREFLDKQKIGKNHGLTADDFLTDADREAEDTLGTAVPVKPPLIETNEILYENIKKRLENLPDVPHDATAEDLIKIAEKHGASPEDVQLLKDHIAPGPPPSTPRAGVGYDMPDGTTLRVEKIENGKVTFTRENPLANLGKAEKPFVVPEDVFGKMIAPVVAAAQTPAPNTPEPSTPAAVTPVTLPIPPAPAPVTPVPAPLPPTPVSDQGARNIEHVEKLEQVAESVAPTPVTPPAQVTTDAAPAQVEPAPVERTASVEDIEQPQNDTAPEVETTPQPSATTQSTGTIPPKPFVKLTPGREKAVTSYIGKLVHPPKRDYAQAWLGYLLGVAPEPLPHGLTFQQAESVRQKMFDAFDRPKPRPQPTLVHQGNGNVPEPNPPSTTPEEKEVIQSETEPQAQNETAPTQPEEKHTYSSTQADITGAMGVRIRDISSKIPAAELAEDGREEHPHITVKYGLHGEDPKEVEEVLKGEGPITAKIGKVSIFKTDKGDVVKMDIESPDLHRLNGKIAKLEHTDTYPDYKPHITLAYVKSGKGKKYDGMSIHGVTGRVLTFNSITHSAKSGPKTEIALSGNENPSTEVSEKKPVTPQLPTGAAGATPLGVKPSADDKAQAPVKSAAEAAGISRQEILDKAAKALEEMIGAPPAPTPSRSPGVRTAAEIDKGKKRIISGPKQSPATPEQATNPLAAASEAAEKRLREKYRTQLNSGVDPTDLVDLATIGARHIIDGALKFHAWAKRMMDHVGPVIRAVARVSGQTAGATLREVHSYSSELSKRYGKNPEATPDQFEPAEEITGEEDESVRKPNSKPLEEKLPQENKSPGGIGTTSESGGRGGRTSRDDSGTGQGEGPELEPGAGTVSGVVGNPATPEQTFPPRDPQVNSTSHDRDYRIPDDRVVSGSPEKRARINIAAIRTLRQIEKENRTATVEEMPVLAGYVGWGAVKQLFAGSTPEFMDLQNQLRELLSDAEYESASASTTNAHYTGDAVVDAMWEAMQHLGAKPGMSWLEPAMGSGNFFGRQPVELLPGSRRVGVEKDEITGKIAKLLYPDSGIDIYRFEQTEMPENYFDGAISNVPFSKVGVHDPVFRGKHFLTTPIHNYFFAKTVGLVRPGGVVAFITSRHTMDSYGPDHTKFRKWISDRMDLLGAVRLPTNAFMQSSGTHVITDIIFLRRRLPNAKPAGENWENTVSKFFRGEHGSENHAVNEYFTAHPEMILGKEGLSRGQYSATDYDVKGTITKDSLTAALKKIAPEGEGFQDYTTSKATKKVALRDINAPGADKIGGLFFDDKGVLYRKTSKGSAVPIEVSGTVAARVKGQLLIRDELVNLMDAERTDRTEEELNRMRKRLNNAYDIFVKKHGLLSSLSNTAAMAGDPEAPLLTTLEHNYDRKEKKADKGPIFSRRMLSADKGVTSVDNVTDAMLVALNEKGRLDWQRMSELTGKTEDQLQKELSDLGRIYMDHDTRTWQTAEEYLSGSVRTKLKQAQAIAKIEPRFEKNVEALKIVQPEDIPPGKIRVSLGVTWVPIDVYTEFANHLIGSTEPTAVFYTGGEWALSEKGRWSANNQWDTKRAAVPDLLEATLNSRLLTIHDRIPGGGSEINTRETAAARARQREINDYFGKWIFTGDRAVEMARLYNDINNDIRLREYNGAHLTLPGMSRDASVVRGGNLEPHQLAAIWRQINQPNVLLDHAVGTGKTFEMIAAAMELKRLGLIKRPMFVVPNATLGGWQMQFNALYPAAKVLVFSETDLQAKKRQRVIANIAIGEWDAVVIPASSFGLIRTGDDIFNLHYKELEDELHESIRLANEGGVDTRLIRRMENASEALLTSLLDKRNEGKKDNTVSWEQLGIDQLYVDEAHEFKRLGFATKQGQIAGIDNGSNQMTFDLLMKVRYTQTHGRGVTFATGTPITNTMGELYNLMKYLIPQELKARGIGRFDEWSSAFGRTVPIFERRPEGGGYQTKNRFAKFVNIPELSSLYRSFADVITADMVDIPVPELFTGGREGIVSEMTEAQYEAMGSLQHRASAIRADPRRAMPDNMLAVYTDATKLALDLRMLQPDSADDPDGRLNKAADTIYEIWRDSKEVKGTQAVFSDIGKPASAGGSTDFSAYDELVRKLVSRGIPADEIRFIYDAKNRTQRAQLFKALNDGAVRVILGSTKKMGVGVNIQKRLIAAHHLDIPHRPADLEQREGRIMRQGNMNPKVHEFYYIAKGSLDENKFGNVLRKAKFISNFRKGALGGIREAEDVGDLTPSLEMFQAMSSGDPRIMRKLELEGELDQLGYEGSAFRDHQFSARRTIPEKQAIISFAEKDKAAYQKAIEIRDATGPKWVIDGHKFDTTKDKASDIGKAIYASLKNAESAGKGYKHELGEAYGLNLTLEVSPTGGSTYVMTGNVLVADVPWDAAEGGIYARINPFFTERLDQRLSQAEKSITDAKHDIAELHKTIEKAWPAQNRFNALQDELDKLIAELQVDKPDDAAAAGEGDINDSSVEAEDTEDDDGVAGEVDGEDEDGDSNLPKKSHAADKHSMSVYKPSTKQPETVEGKNGEKGYYQGIADGEPITFTGHYLLRGETKKPVESPYDAGRIQEIWGTYTAGERIQPTGFMEGKDKRYVWFNDGSVMDSRFFDQVNRRIPDVTFHAGSKGAIVVNDKDGKKAGVIMGIHVKSVPGLQELIDKSKSKPVYMGSGLGGLQQLLDKWNAAPKISQVGTQMRDLFGEGKNGEPRENYSGMGAIKDTTVRNLSQLEEASPSTHTAAVQAASSKAQSATILRGAVPVMKKALRGGIYGLEEMRLSLIESRLRGIRDRWINFARQAAQMSDAELEKSFDEHFAWVLNNLEGKKDLPQNIAQTAASLVEKKEWKTLRDFLSDTFMEAADHVAVAMPDAWYDAVTKDSKVKEALRIYKELVEKPMAENHAINEGVFSTALGPLDTYYPLIPIEPEDRPKPGPGRRLPYRKPKNIANAFATGLGEGYDATMDALKGRVEAGVFNNNKAAVVTALEKAGLLRKLKKSEPVPDVFKWRGVDYTATLQEVSPQKTLIKDGQVIHVPATFALMPKWVWREMHPILEKGSPATPNLLKRMISGVNVASLAGPADLVFHAANLMGTLIANTPYLDASVHGKILSAPVIKKFYTIVKLINTDPSTEESAADLLEMARVGVIPDRYASVTYSRKLANEMGAEKKSVTLTPVLYGPNGFDIRARLIMWRLAKEMNPNATPQQLYHFVNQLGNYVPALQGEIERAVKSSGLAPFYTAGSTMLRNGVNALTGSGPLPTNSRAARLWLRLYAGAIGLIAAWILIHKAMTGKFPWEDVRAKFLQIPAPEALRRSTVGLALWGRGPEVGYINFGFFNPLVTRGSRLLGIPGFVNTLHAGGSIWQAIDGAAVNSADALSAPFLGPPVRDAWVGLTGKEAYMTDLRDSSGKLSPEFMPAVNPKEPAGLKSTAERAAAALLQTNAFYSSVGEGTGMMGDTGKRGNHWARMAVDMVSPGFVSNSSNPYATREALRRQRHRH